MRTRFKVLLGVLVAVLVVFVGFVVWAQTIPPPMQEALNALQPSPEVTVRNEQWLIFEPANSNYSVGLIIYPGGRIDYRSYAPLAHLIAKEGYLTVIAPMPLNLAVFGINTANDVINAFPDVDTWAIAGHSLGGTMAAQFAYENPDKIQGLIFWAAYPASGTDLSQLQTKVATIHGTNDGLVSSQEIENSLKQLPPDTTWTEIQGGNHAQYGWYGDQEGDNPATISREQQQTQTANATIQILQQLK